MARTAFMSAIHRIQQHPESWQPICFPKKKKEMEQSKFIGPPASKCPYRIPGWAKLSPTFEVYLGPVANVTWYEAEARAKEMASPAIAGHHDVIMLEVESEEEQEALLKIKDCESNLVQTCIVNSFTSIWGKYCIKARYGIYPTKLKDRKTVT